MTEVRVELVKGGFVVLGDSTKLETADVVSALIGKKAHLVIADPPYGNIVQESWDRTKLTELQFAAWMIEWTMLWNEALAPKGAFYVWGGIGKPGFRPFFRYCCNVEKLGEFEMSNMITWSKKRAIGRPNNYLFTREECAYFTKGKANDPLVFNIPLLDQKRGYAGFNKKYPAKSEFYRRTNVWTDINEIFSGKRHPTQKKQELYEVIINVHTNPGDWVIDPFAGAGTAAFACKKLGRRFVIVEKDETYFNDTLSLLRDEPTP